MSAYRERLLGLLGSDDPFDVLAATPAFLSNIVDRLGDAGIERSVAPGKWTARQIVAHLADVEQAIGFRVRQIVTAAPGHVIQPLDQDLWARPYSELDIRTAVRALEALRPWNLAYYRTLSRDDLARIGHHPERGDESAETTIRLQAGHDRNHLEQLEQIAGK